MELEEKQIVDDMKVEETSDLIINCIEIDEQSPTTTSAEMLIQKNVCRSPENKSLTKLNGKELKASKNWYECDHCKKGFRKFNLFLFSRLNL